jgi:hypothetical protein
MQPATKPFIEAPDERLLSGKAIVATGATQRPWLGGSIRHQFGSGLNVCGDAFAPALHEGPPVCVLIVKSSV